MRFGGLMRLIVLLVAGILLPAMVKAQERWHRLPAGASAFHVDLHSLSFEQGTLWARVQTDDLGSAVLVEEVEVRCGTEQLRTTAQFRYDSDTGQPVPAQADRQLPDAHWIGYPRGSEGHALLSALCRLGRDRKLLGSAEPSDA